MANKTVRAHDLQNIEFELVDLGSGKWALGSALLSAGVITTTRNGSNAQVFDGSATFANNAAAGTIVNLEVPLPASLQGDALYLISITNPSTETALTVRVRTKETLNAVARYPELTSFGVAVNTPDGKSVLVQGWMLGEAGRLSISNDTVLGAAGAFTAFVRVRKI